MGENINSVNTSEGTVRFNRREDNLSGDMAEALPNNDDTSVSVDDSSDDRESLTENNGRASNSVSHPRDAMNILQYCKDILIGTRIDKLICNCGKYIRTDYNNA